MLIYMKDSNENAEIRLEAQIKARIFYKNSNTIFVLNISICFVIVVLNLSQFSLLKGSLNTNFGLGCKVIGATQKVWIEL